MRGLLVCLLLTSCAVVVEEECHSFVWTIDRGSEWCEGRFVHEQLVFMGCEEKPAPTCTMAEKSDRSDVWCCWEIE